MFAVPGDIDRPHVAGCHALIRDGATLARGAQDVLDELRIMVLPLEGEPATKARPSDPLHAKILETLRAGETTLDELCEACGETPARVLAALSLLEMSGFVEPRAGSRYASVSAGKRC